MNKNINKGGSGERLSDLIEYLEYKILHNEESEQEYELYTDYKWLGHNALKDKRFRRKLIKWYSTEKDNIE